MRRLTFSSLLAAITLMVPAEGRAEAKPTPQLAPANAPKSEFRLGYGRDPFFPTSKEVVIKQPDVDKPRPPVEAAKVPEFVALRGISTANGRKLAIINYQTVGENEEFTLKRGTQRLVVRCVDIKDQSVVVSCEGATKELFLRAP